MGNQDKSCAGEYPRGPSQLAQQMDRLYAAINICEDLDNNLREELCPILQPDVPMSGG